MPQLGQFLEFRCRRSKSAGVVAPHGLQQNFVSIVCTTEGEIDEANLSSPD